MRVSGLPQLTVLTSSYPFLVALHCGTMSSPASSSGMFPIVPSEDRYYSSALCCSYPVKLTASIEHLDRRPLCRRDAES
jgi:hypothetical protein